MGTAQNKLKQSFDVLKKDVLKKWELSFDIDTRKYYFAKIKKDKEGYILFLFMILNWLDVKGNIDNYIVDKHAYMNCENGKIEDITLIDVMKVRTKYFKQQQ